MVSPKTKQLSPQQNDKMLSKPSSVSQTQMSHRVGLSLSLFTLSPVLEFFGNLATVVVQFASVNLPFAYSILINSFTHLHHRPLQMPPCTAF